jgi:hypothetical protein
MESRNYDRVVIGGGLFGTFAALILGKIGYKVLLVEQSDRLMTRASFVNQARLHTGLHYPRSIVTAREALNYYEIFRNRFPDAVIDFEQIYAVSNHNSKTSAVDFEGFIKRLGVDYEEVNVDQHFEPGRVAAAFRVEEPTFDSNILRNLLLSQVKSIPGIQICLNQGVVGGKVSDANSILELSDGSKVETAGVVIATYAGINSIRQILGLSQLPLSFEIAEIVVGSVSPEMQSIGYTVMDGPFWSMMPFGSTGSVSLTSVGMTPLARSTGIPVFACQSRRSGCTPIMLADCNTCQVRPRSGMEHQLKQMQMFMKNKNFFKPTGSLMTVKSILSTTEVDDARPTLVQKEEDSNTWTVFSGKVSTLFDLEEALN